MTSKQNLRANNIHAVTIAALDLFYKNGIDNSTVNDIASRAGISKMSVFRYFNTKMELVASATRELFNTLDEKFEKSDFSNNSNHLSGMQLSRKYLEIYPYLIEYHPEFLNYLCEVVLFFSRQEIAYNFPKFNLLEDFWLKALERGMADKSIAVIENYETSHQTIHNLFMGVNLRLYLKRKDLTPPDISQELKRQTQRIMEMTIKYLEP